MWKGHVLTRVIEKAHSGPVFAMFSSVNENKVLSGGKERGYVYVHTHILVYALLLIKYNNDHF